MKYVAGFIVALVCAVGSDVAWVMLQDVTKFESATAFGPATKVLHFLSLSAFVFVLILVPTGATAAVPFAASFYLLRRRLPHGAASLASALVAALFVLPVFARLHHRIDEDERPMSAWMMMLLPQVAVSGLVGGAVFGTIARARAV